MVGRPKNPNRPPTVTAVRITKRTRDKLLAEHWGNEPYGHTVERALDNLIELRKKVKALEQGQDRHLLHYTNANDELIRILKKRDDEIGKLKAQRKAMHVGWIEG